MSAAGPLSYDGDSGVGGPGIVEPCAHVTDVGENTSDAPLQNTAFLIQLVCLALAFVIGLFIKRYKIHFLHEAGATLLLGRGLTLAIEKWVFTSSLTSA